MTISCSKSTAKISGISDIKATIDIYQRLTDINDNSISVTLYDKENKEIGNDSIRLWINKKEMDYKVIQNLYYTKDYLYHSEKLKIDNNLYELEIQLPNGEKFFLGSIAALRPSSSRTIIYNPEASLNNDFHVQWTNLYDVNLLILSKSVEILDQKEKNITTVEEQPYDTIKIGPSGSYTLPKEKFSKPNEKLDILSLTFTAEKIGKINPELAKGSSIVITGNHDEQAHFK